MARLGRAQPIRAHLARPLVAPITLLTGLSAYYKLDEASGNALDATGNGNTAIDHGSAGTASGKINAARTFDGSTQWLSLPTNFGAGASPGGPFSASLWAYADATSGDQVLLGRYESARDRMFQIWLRGTHLGVAYGSNPFDTIDDAGSISAGTWHHLAFTFSTLGVGTLYVDGSSVGSDPSPTADFTSTATLDAGRRSDGMFPFAGRLDEIGWWSRELTAGEVSSLYGGGSGLAYPFTGGGTTYTASLSGTLAASAALARSTGKALSGTLTAAATLARRTGKAMSGSLSASGSLVRSTGKALAGSVAASATLARRAGKTLSGTLTASGSLAKIRAILRSFSGTLTASGSLARQTGKPFSGSLASSATLARSALKSFAGTLAASGTLARIRAVLKSFSGTLTASGSAVARQSGKALSGTLAASGATTRALSRALAGTLAASAALAKRPGKPLAGTLSATGSTVARMTGKALSGSLTASGSLSKRVARALTGTLAASGSFLKSIVGSVFTPSRHPDPSRSTGRRLGPDPSRSTGSRD